MRKISNKVLLASASLVALGLATASDAKAFDAVDWEWDKDVIEVVNINADIDVVNTPSGMVQLEKLQVQLGNVEAESIVSGINNNTAGESGSGLAAINETLTFTVGYEDQEGSGGPINLVEDLSTSGGLTAAITGGAVDEDGDSIDEISIDLSGTTEVIPVDAIDAIDLPTINSVATALGNSQAIESDVSVQLHDGQFLAGTFNVEEGGEGSDVDLSALETTVGLLPNTGNTHTDIAALVGAAGATGLIEPASVTANSDVSNILNALVNSNATAVGNNIDVAVDAVISDDAVVIGDVTQVAYANLSATSTVTGVDVNNYTNFGAANMGPLAGENLVPLVNSVATAVGNNFAVRVSSPGPVVDLGDTY